MSNDSNLMAITPAAEATALVGRVRRDPPAWADEHIEAWDEAAFKRLEPFATSRYWCENESLNVFRIIGTRHPDYQNRSWRWLLENGKRMRLNLPLHVSNPDYYLDQAHKAPTMSFISLDGHSWFIKDDGNHRVCIARFDFHYRQRTLIHGVKVNDWRIDHGLLEAYQELADLIQARRLPWRLDAARRTVRREDGAGWMRETFAPTLQVTREDGTARDYDAAGTRQLLHEASRPWYRRFFPAGGRS